MRPNSVWSINLRDEYTAPPEIYVTAEWLDGALEKAERSALSYGMNRQNIVAVKKLFELDDADRSFDLKIETPR